jgi:hypothetical protein
MEELAYLDSPFAPSKDACCSSSVTAASFAATMSLSSGFSLQTIEGSIGLMEVSE